jgi:phospholipid/cholesterol/gamma-HCH transport system substrate-binding protein
MDTVIAQEVKQAIVSIRITGAHSAEITGNLGSIVKDVKNGKGSFGALLMDTSLSGQIRQAVVKIKVTSDNSAIVTGNLASITGKMDSGRGMMARLLMDTTIVPNLDKTMVNLNKTSKDADIDLVGLRHSWPLRHYFKKQEEKRKADSAK